MAIEELQLHDLQNMDATELSADRTKSSKNNAPAVDVKQKASPAIHDDPTVPKIPANGRDIKAPIVIFHFIVVCAVLVVGVVVAPRRTLMTKSSLLRTLRELPF